MFKKFLFVLSAVVALTISASAETIETTADFVGMNYFHPLGENSSFNNYSQPKFKVSIPRQGNDTLLQADVDIGDSRRVTFSCSEFSVSSLDSNGFYGDIGFYLTYYGVLTDYHLIPSGSWTASDLTGYNVTVKNGNGEVITTDWIHPEVFLVENSSLPDGSYSYGVHYSFSIRVPEYTPILKISFGEAGYAHTWWESADPNVGYNGDIGYVIPSATLIADRTSAELKELENISNAILEQNNLSSQYFGEVISKVDSLYTEVGNLADLQEQSIQQFDDWNIVNTVPSSVQDKVDKADTVINDINSLVKPSPDTINPDTYLPTTDDLEPVNDVFGVFFQNALIVQLCMMALGFAFVSYVLFGKKG